MSKVNVERWHAWMVGPLLIALIAGLLAASPAHSTAEVELAELEFAELEFQDTAGNTHQAAIDVLAATRITAGCDASGTLYCPSDAVTRGQMATFVVRTMELIELPLPSSPPDAFPDDDGSPHELAINKLAAEGVLLGGADGLIRPRDPVTRGQMALYLQRAFDLPPGDATVFTDVGPTFMEAVGAIAAAEITQGCTADGTRYCTNDPVRRDQMASFILRTLQRVGGDVLPSPGDSETHDEPPSVPDDAHAEDAPEETGLGDDDSEAPPDEDHDIIGHPAIAAGSGGDPRSALPPPDVQHAEVASLQPLAPLRTFDPDGEGEDADGEASVDLSILYPGQPTFAMHSRGYLQYNSLPAAVGFLELWRGGRLITNCSGTVVGRDLVLTAAHCVADFDCFRFWPDRFGSHARYGAWDSCRGYYPTNYQVGRTTGQQWFWVYDYAILKMQPNSRGHIGDVVGRQRVLTDTAGLNLAKYSMGYPTEGWFATHRTYPWHCYAPDARRYNWGNGWASMGWGCELNGGKSGGPVFAQYNGQWWVVSVTSTGGHIVACGLRCRWYMQNAWGPSFRNGPFNQLYNYVATSG